MGHWLGPLHAAHFIYVVTEKGQHYQNKIIRSWAAMEFGRMGFLKLIDI